MLQVHDIGPQITTFQNTYDFHIGCEFFGTISKQQSDNNICSTLENSTFSIIQENESNQFILCILCIGNEKGGSASLLFISNKQCYIFDLHSRNLYGLPIYCGTSILASFKSWENTILHIHFVNSLSQSSGQNPTDLYSMCIVSFHQVNIQMQGYFIDQKYQFLKSQPLAKDFEKQRTVQ